VLPRRASLGGFRQLAEYYRFLRDEPASGLELDHLAAVLTEHEPALMHSAVSDHVRRFARTRALAACESDAGQIAILAIGPASADDAYSAAIILAEEGLDVLSPRVQFAAADVDLDRLLKSADGRYSSRAVAAVSEESMRRLFERMSSRQYRIAAELRARVRWLYADAADGPPRSVRNRRWDLIICRELLGNLAPRAANAWAAIGHMLSPGGILLADRRAGIVGDLECSRCGKFWIHMRHEGWRGQQEPVANSDGGPPYAGLGELARTGTLWTMTRMLRADDADAALAHAGAIAERDPFDAGSRLAMAVLLLRRRAIRKAHALAIAALAIDPHSPEALMVCAMTCERRNRLKEAEQFYRKAILVRPTMASAHIQLAGVCRKMKRDADARRIFDQLRSVLGSVATGAHAAGRQIRVAPSDRTEFTVGVDSVIRPL